MNYLKLSGSILAILLCCATISAQQQRSAPINEPQLSKPRLFDDLPAVIPVSVSELKSMMTGTVQGKDVNVNLADKRKSTFAGKIVSAAAKYDDKIRSVVIRSTNYHGATFTLSSSTNPDGTVTYKGRIISFQHADLFELEKRGEDYVLVKKNYYDLVNE